MPFGVEGKVCSVEGHAKGFDNTGHTILSMTPTFFTGRSGGEMFPQPFQMVKLSLPHTVQQGPGGRVGGVQDNVGVPQPQTGNSEANPSSNSDEFISDLNCSPVQWGTGKVTLESSTP